MKYFLSIFTFAVAATLCISCDKECNDVGVNEPYDCTFVQNDDDQDGIIDATERSLMDQCLENRLTKTQDISANLIGEWELIGHGEGWFPETSQPCGYLWVTADSIKFQFQNATIDTTAWYSWSIEEVNTESGVGLVLTPLPIQGLFISTFCDQYMFGDATPVDGNMYLYEKVK